MSSNKPVPPPCSCPLAGYCERHGRNKSSHLHKLCQERDDYRALFDEKFSDPGFVPPCVCEGPGFCQRHGRPKTKAQFELCKNQPELRATWDGQIVTEEQSTTPSSLPRSSPPLASPQTGPPPSGARRVVEVHRRPPGLIRQGINYVSARQRWTAAGKPMRSPEDTAALFAICVQCDNYKPHATKPNQGQCSECGCSLKEIGETFNKLAWATEGCPNGVRQGNPKPYWVPAAYAPGEQPAEPPTVYDITTKQPLPRA